MNRRKFIISPWLLLTFACTVIVLQSFLEPVESVSCDITGVCRDSGSSEQTVCKKCKSCTYKNCCNKVFTSPRFKCNIDGWKAKDYKGDIELQPGTGSKRDIVCTKASDCPKGAGCVAYNKKKPDGFCWKAPDGSTAGNSALAAAVAIAGLVLIL